MTRRDLTGVFALQGDHRPAGEHRAAGGDPPGQGQAELEGAEDLPRRDGDRGGQCREGAQQSQVQMTNNFVTPKYLEIKKTIMNVVLT